MVLIPGGGLIKSDVVEAAMLKVDRGNYAPSNADAYDDRPLPIGFGATISAPHMHATALELLSEQITRPNSRVLDVGCGSGYLRQSLLGCKKQQEGAKPWESITSLAWSPLRRPTRAEGGRDLLA
ncbi:unnamed protein product, partial [Heterosigma akashiwo]